MTLRAKVFIVTGVVLSSLVLALYFSSQAILLRTFADLEARQARANMQHVLDELQEELAHLDRKASDWADWDDAYAFVVDRDPAFIESNIQDTTLIGLDLNLILFLDASGRPVVGRAFDLQTGRAAPLPTGIERHLTTRSPLLRREPPDRSVTGVVSLPRGPMLVVSRPILTSHRKGPIRGTLIMGRYLDSGLVRRLRATTQRSLTVHRPDDPRLPSDLRADLDRLLAGTRVGSHVLGTHEVAEHAVVNDIYGQPTLLLRAVEPRTVYAQGRVVLDYFVWSLVVSGLVFSAAIVLGQEMVVLARLSSLSKAVTRIGATGDLSARVSIGGEDELSRLGCTINEMLEALQGSQRERDEAQEALRQANEKLEARVLERTAELAGANEVLQAEIGERRRAEEALRASERRFRALIENGSDIVSLMDGNGAFIYLSPSFTRILGYPVADLIGADAFGLVHPEDLARVRQVFATAIQEPAAEFPLRHRVRHHDGSWRHLESTARNRLSEPAIRAVVVNARDVTERVRADEELARLQQELQQAQKMEVVGRLAGGVAHDFNNLLVPIMMYSDLLLTRLEADDPRRRFAEQISKTAERAAALPRQLLAFSRKQVLQPKVISLNVLIGDMGKMLQRLIGEDVALTVVPGDALGQVRADPGQIEQVITNLAVNARDAMPEGGGLALETANVDLEAANPRLREGIPPGRYVLLSISDTGCGMDPETQARIFEPFFTTKEVGKGTGLGLSTVHGIVAQSGGHIRVESEVGRGTTFRIYLPWLDGAEDVAAEPGEETAAGGAEVILLAEDDAAVREGVQECLNRAGYTVLTAPDGGQAITLSQEHPGPIHLLLTDVVMPGMSGRQLAERLSVRRPETKVLYMSGYTDDAVVRHGVMHEQVAFLQKPFTPQTLLRRLRQVLDGSGAG